MNIRLIPQPATRADKAPRPKPRDNPADTAVESSREAVIDGPERRRNPDRRRGRRKAAIERRLGAERRRRSVDINV